MTKTSQNGLIKLAGIILSLVGLSTGFIVWAATEDSKIKDWAAEQDRFHQQAIIEMTREYYVPRSDFVRVETILKNQNEDVKDIQGDMDGINETVEKIYRSINNRRNSERK